jgi:hypothetical protein
MAEHDSGYKLLFSHPKMVEELLSGFIREGWVEDLDFGTLERVGDSYVSDDLRERHSDMVWRLRWRGGKEGWFYVYLLLEFQSTPDMFMALRLLGYVALLLSGLVRTGKVTTAEGLPAVLPLVLYNGKRPWSVPLDLASLFRTVPTGCERATSRSSPISWSTRAGCSRRSWTCPAAGSPPSFAWRPAPLRSCPPWQPSSRRSCRREKRRSSGTTSRAGCCACSTACVQELQFQRRWSWRISRCSKRP